MSKKRNLKKWAGVGPDLNPGQTLKNWN